MADIVSDVSDQTKNLVETQEYLKTVSWTCILNKKSELFYEWNVDYLTLITIIMSPK